MTRTKEYRSYDFFVHKKLPELPRYAFTDIYLQLNLTNDDDYTLYQVWFIWILSFTGKMASCIYTRLACTYDCIYRRILELILGREYRERKKRSPIITDARKYRWPSDDFRQNFQGGDCASTVSNIDDDNRWFGFFKTPVFTRSRYWIFNFCKKKKLGFSGS